MKKIIFAMLILLVFSANAYSKSVKEPAVFFVWKPRTGGSILLFSRKVMELALQNTKEEYGPFVIKELSQMNRLRVLWSLRNSDQNIFIDTPFDKRLFKDFDYVPFPIHRGIIGYRAFFVSPKAKKTIGDVKTLEDLKKYSIGQGVGWLDTDILLEQKFKVISVSRYESLFKMVASDRFDLFARGITELYHEYDFRKSSMKNLITDEKFVLYYPFPRFYMTRKGNRKSIERVKKGLILAYKNGSYKKLWRKFYDGVIKRSNLKKRKIFRINNPMIDGIDKSYSKYIYNPF